MEAAESGRRDRGGFLVAVESRAVPAASVVVVRRRDGPDSEDAQRDERGDRNLPHLSPPWSVTEGPYDSGGRSDRGPRLGWMEDVYWLGVFLGLGVAIGVLLAGLLGTSRAGLLVAVAAAAVAGFVVGLTFAEEQEAAAGAIGGIFGGAAAAEIVRGALRRGGDRWGTAALVGAAAVAVAALAFVPLVGYLETLALPLLAIRMRRRLPERYAGLRTLARD
jgi:hypothetical protein